jgi:DNA-binding NtrC family response regulator
MPRRILIVDDERGVRMLCSDVLRRSGYETEAVQSASAALDRIAAASFDMAIVDIHMPLMSGIELCRRMRGIRPDLPVALITGYPSIESAVRGIGFGASDYVSKPFTPEALREVVARVLQRAARARSVAYVPMQTER